MANGVGLRAEVASSSAAFAVSKGKQDLLEFIDCRHKKTRL
jgi:hypothetical protein